MAGFLYFALTFGLGLKLVFGKIDENKLTPGVTIEEATKRFEIAGYLLMVIAVIVFIACIMI